MGKASSSSSSSSSSFSMSSSITNPIISTASSLTRGSSSSTRHLHTDLRLGLSISSSTHTQHVGPSISRGQWQQNQPHLLGSSEATESNDSSDHNSFFVKVYMEGIPIGRKLNLLAHDGYQELVNTLEQMFDTTILWGSEMDAVQPERCHVLTYEDGEGDLIMVGDVPWDYVMTDQNHVDRDRFFLSTVKRLKITRVDTFGD